MDWIELLLVALVGLGAAFVQRVSGFGLGIFAMMFLPHLLPDHTAAATISCLFSCVTSTYNAVRYRKDVAYKTMLPMLIAALITIPIAVYFSGNISGDLFRLLLGVVLILLSIYFLFLGKRITLKPTIAGGITAGTIGGVLSGLFSTGGPPAVMYLTSAATDSAVYFATIQFYFCCTNLYSLATRALNGMITVDLLFCTGIGLLGCLVGNILGKLIFDKLDFEKLKLVIYLGMIASGVTMLI
jgi:uncharacterized membrane protein YfcA